MNLPRPDRETRRGSILILIAGSLWLVISTHGWASVFWLVMTFVWAIAFILTSPR